MAKFANFTIYLSLSTAFTLIQETLAYPSTYSPIQKTVPLKWIQIPAKHSIQAKRNRQRPSVHRTDYFFRGAGLTKVMTAEGFKCQI